ncbi:MAG: EAL domain-containing protein [Clostridium sp.]|nr:EAL domain-containing protein [Clostridium sp.]
MKKKERTIFREILIPLLAVLAFEMLFMVGSIIFGGVVEQLDTNVTDILAKQTENRGNYLLSEMIGNWSGLELLADEIDADVQSRLSQGTLKLDDLKENSTACVTLLKDISPELIDTMYNKKISGIFVVFYTDGLKESGLPNSLPGVYLRDLDPTATPSERNADLLWERAPGDLIKSAYIATDSGWKPNFSQEDIGQDFFYKPYQTAYEDGCRLKEKDYGYWTTKAYSLEGDNRSSIAYSIPLILDDGTLYGVLGIELLSDYVQSLLPDAELLDDKRGTYILAVNSGDDKLLTPIVVSSDTIRLQQAQELQFVLSEDNSGAESADKDYLGAAKPLVVYSNNAPFDSDEWYLLGVASRKNLFAFSRQMQRMLFISIVLTFIIGLLGIIYASFRLSKPIRNLSEEVEKAQPDNMPVLPATGIREIDRFADSISRLGREVVASSTRLLSIMDMASVELAGYELQEENDGVYVTDKYFPMLGVSDVDIRNLTLQEFLNLQQKIHQSLDHFEAEDSSIVYSVPQADGSLRYLRFEQQKKDGRQVGLIEDVTVSTLEKMRIERERDSDGLTKLYARRGFRREADKLFLKPEVLKHAGLLMIDLDNLKTTNDRFGHNFGDLYIQTAGRCFVENTPENTLCARMSGDEFILLFYGYNNSDEIREKIAALYQAIREIEFVLPNGDNMGLSASGGVAWYPEDSGELSELMKYADFAMYQVKRSKKGEYREFEENLYKQQLLQNQSKLEFHKMLETRDINYFFQPIFDGVTGTVHAYEALMRANFPALREPETVLGIAKEEERLHAMECITLFHASACYQKLLERGVVQEDALVFINSIAGECLTKKEKKEYHELYDALHSRIVVELTGAEYLDKEILERKSRTEVFSGMFALDNYKSGEDGENSLLQLRPKYIKVDISVVRDVDKDSNKQQIISKIVEYARERDMLIVAMGVETEEELQKVLELGVDLLQGYYLARPAETPLPISDEALRIIEKMQNK